MIATGQSQRWQKTMSHAMEEVDEYLRQGVKIVWIAIASTREVMVCKKEGKHSVKDTLTAPELLPGFELKVDEIFAGIRK